MFGRIKKSLTKTRENVFSKVNRLINAKKHIDDELLDELEEILITGDVGVDTTLHVLDNIRDRVRRERYENAEELNELIRDEVRRLLDYEEMPAVEQKPKVILVVGVNGTGKTTSVAKMAHYYKSNGQNVLLAAADTFRAAAIEQLVMWGERVGVEVIRHKAHADPAAVVFDACNAARARLSDVLIVDTAGRLHTKSNLMSELEKIKRIISRQIEGAPHEIILVLDAGNGQNAVSQAKEFVKSADVNSIFLSKLDGTAKGGVVLGIKRELGIPVRYIGLGEKAEDMEIFNAREFAEGLFSN